MGQPQVHLTGAAVTLRDFTLDDAPGAHLVVGDPRVTDFLSFDAKTLPQTESMILGILDRRSTGPRNEYYLAVETSGQLIGFARLALAGVRAGKLGYAIRADYWGRGHATDAARTLTSFGFNELGLHRVSAAIGPDNPGSVAVAERLGFVREGRLRDHVHTNGEWRDSILYSALAHEWTPASLDATEQAAT